MKKKSSPRRKRPVSRKMVPRVAAKIALDLQERGKRRRGEVLIGIPHVAIKGAEARCAVTLVGLHSKPFKISGNDTLQALCLALSFAGRRLNDFVAKGGKIFFAGTDSEFPVEAYFALDRLEAKLTKVAEAHARVLAVHGETFRKLAE